MVDGTDAVGRVLVMMMVVMLLLVDQFAVAHHHWNGSAIRIGRSGIQMIRQTSQRLLTLLLGLIIIVDVMLIQVVIVMTGMTSWTRTARRSRNGTQNNFVHRCSVSLSLTFTSLHFLRNKYLNLKKLYNVVFFFKVIYLDIIFLHGQRSVDSVQFEIKSASIADGFSLIVSAPQGSCRRRAISAP